MIQTLGDCILSVQSEDIQNDFDQRAKNCESLEAEILKDFEGTRSKIRKYLKSDENETGFLRKKFHEYFVGRSFEEIEQNLLISIRADQFYW